MAGCVKGNGTASNLAGNSLRSISYPFCKSKASPTRRDANKLGKQDLKSNSKLRKNMIGKTGNVQCGYIQNLPSNLYSCIGYVTKP